MKKVAKREIERSLLIHNDLFNAAHYFKETIEKKTTSGNTEGGALDCMACLVFLAFTVEAHINFLGQKLLPKWNEMNKFSKKLNSVLTHLGISPNFKQRPYSTINELKAFRDLLAHGKPIKEEFTEIITDYNPETLKKDILTADWEKYCQLDVVAAFYEDVDKLWEDWIKRSGLKRMDTITQGNAGLSVEVRAATSKAL